MKIEYRKPSIKKSISARTIGKSERAIKKAIIPGYGKKGTGWIKNPKKATYNYIYNRTTKSMFEDTNSSKNNQFYQTNSTTNPSSESAFEVVEKDKIRIGNSYYTSKALRKFAIFYIVVAIFLILISFSILPFGIFTLIVGIWLLYTAYEYLKLCNISDKK